MLVEIVKDSMHFQVLSRTGRDSGLRRSAAAANVRAAVQVVTMSVSCNSWIAFAQSEKTIHEIHETARSTNYAIAELF